MVPSTLGDVNCYVAPSAIPNAGWGLFAKRYMKEGTLVTVYHGDVLTYAEYVERYPEGGAQYVVRLNANCYIDAYLWGCLARYANHAPATKANCVLRASGNI